MADPTIIRECDVRTETSALVACWEESPTFLFLPDKNRLTDSWIDRAIDSVPEDFRSGCFGILTSGSTGKPKLIMGSKARAEKLVSVLHELQHSEAVEETVGILPLSYSYAFINQWLWAHVFKRKLHLTRGFSEPDRLKATLSRARSAMLCMVGGQVQFLRRYYPEETFPAVIRLHFAGGRFPQEELEFLSERFPNARIYNNYGCAEAMPRLTLRRSEASDDAACVGRPLPGIEIDADDGNQMMFRSPYGAVAYVDSSGFHRIAASDWVPSGDLARQRKDGSWQLLGRSNDVFKRYGEKISVPQLLTTIKQCWAGDIAFYLETDPGGEPGCVMVLSPPPEQQQLRQLLLALRDNHNRPHWPIRIESVENMPMLPNGKYDTAMLKDATGNTLHWRQRI